MTLSVQNDATGGGTGTVDGKQAAGDLSIIANFDSGLTLASPVGNLQQVIYDLNDAADPPKRPDTLVNKQFGVDPSGGPDIIVLAVGGDFILNDGTLLTEVAGTALAPSGSPLPGGGDNGTASCLAIYDTSDSNGEGHCVVRQGSGGIMNLPFPTPALLYHELSHAFRIVENMLKELKQGCNPASPEEAAAIADENVMRELLAVQQSKPPELRDPEIHCGTSCRENGSVYDETGSCCAVGATAAGSALSEDLNQLRSVRDQFFRRNEIGYTFFDALHYAYYGFSPQIATLMAGDTELRATVLNGYVEPLVRMLQLIRDHTIGAEDGPELGRAFMTRLGGDDDARAALDLLDRAVAILEGDDGSGPPLTPTERSVADLLRERALPDEHVSWALVETVRGYHGCLQAWSRGSNPDEIGGYLEDYLTRWCGQMPIADRWATLSTEEVNAALDMLDGSILRKTEPRRVFYGRLMDRYGDVPAVRDAIRSRTEASQ